MSDVTFIPVSAGTLYRSAEAVIAAVLFVSVPPSETSLFGSGYSHFPEIPSLLSARSVEAEGCLKEPI